VRSHGCGIALVHLGHDQLSDLADKSAVSGDKKKYLVLAWGWWVPEMHSPVLMTSVVHPKSVVERENLFWAKNLIIFIV
jgi:hypothetical protein